MYSISACGGDKPLGRQEADDGVNIYQSNADKDLRWQKYAGKTGSELRPPERLVEKSHFLSGLFKHSLILDPVLQRKDQK